MMCCSLACGHILFLLQLIQLECFLAAEEAADDDDVEDVEDVEEDEGVEEDDEEYIEPRDGHEFVDAEEEPEMLFEMQEEDPEMTLESVAAFEAMDPDSIQRVVQNDAMPVPVGELITGKVGPTSMLTEFWARCKSLHLYRCTPPNHGALCPCDTTGDPPGGLWRLC
jgi:hypothetical protein